jgi:hypothetical protein
MLVTSGTGLVKCNIEVFSVVLLKIQVTWNVTVYHWVSSSWYFEGL